MSNKIIYLVKILLVLLVIAFVTNNVLRHLQENKKSPTQQTLDDARLSIIAPTLEKISENETLKYSLAGKVKTVSSYKSTYNGMEYSVRFIEFNGVAILSSGVESIKNLFKNDDFVFTDTHNEVDQLEGVFIDGHFKKENKDFGIKVQLIKQGNYFWQILVIYPQSEKNNTQATEFIQSIKIQPNL
jgi:hypothetical protein